MKPIPTLMPRIISLIPRDASFTPEYLDEQVTHKLFTLWLEREGILSGQEWDWEGRTPQEMLNFAILLTQADPGHAELNSQIFAESVPCSEDLEREMSEYRNALLRALDEIIVLQAESMGWRMGLSMLVQWRQEAWEFQENGPDLFLRYGKALAKAAQVFQRRRRPPLSDPNLYVLRQKSIPELNLLLRQLREWIDGQCNRVEVDALKEWIVARVQEEPDSFPYVASNLAALREYLSVSTHRGLLCAGNKVSAAQFFDDWYGWRTGYDPEKFRQAISTLGSIKRKPS